MKTVTLKLTKSEYVNLINIWENSSYIYNDYSLIKIVKDNELVEIKDINKFREFLNDEIKSTTKKKEIRMNAYVPMKTGHLYNIKINKIKSIVRKLDKECA